MSDVLVQYLREARATECGLAQTLQVHIAGTPPGEHRSRLEQHLEETRAHGERLARRIEELDSDGDPLRQALDLVSAPVGYGLGIARGAARAMLSLVGMPLPLLRGPEPSAADRVLRNVRAESASEALEVATYTAIERLAEAAGDEPTARLAREIRADEERMLSYLQQAVVELSDRLAGRSQVAGRRAERSEGRGQRSEAADERPRAGNGAAPAPSPPAASHVSEEPELVAEFGPPEEAGAEVEVAEPWEGYDRMKAAEIEQRLADASDELVVVVQLYEANGRKRQTVLRAAERRLGKAL
jgi:ferritin-like metal-binding protein YciE